MRAAEKIIEGFTQLMDGFLELQTKIEQDFDAEDSEESSEDGEDPDLRLEIDAALVTEIRATLEAMMDAEDYSADEVASLVSVSQDALEEINPEVFEDSSDEDETVDVNDEEDGDYYVDDDDDDYGYDDDDEEDEDDEEYEDEDED